MNKVKYIIKKGKHKAKGINFGINWGNKEVTWDFYFTKPCWYKRELLNSGTGANKLCGFSFGWDHKKNSIRIGWQPDFDDQGNIWLYFYSYKDGKRWYEQIDKIKPNTKHTVTIKVLKNNIHIVLDGKVTVYNYKKKFRWGYYLFPYFGGNSVAPHNINIHLRRW